MGRVYRGGDDWGSVNLVTFALLQTEQGEKGIRDLVGVWCDSYDGEEKIRDFRIKDLMSEDSQEE